MSKVETIVAHFINKFSDYFVESNNQALIKELEKMFGFKLPNSYRLLLINHDFDKLEFKGVEWFGSYQLSDMIQYDPHLFNGLQKNRLLQVGRPEGGLYDPICIDGNSKRVNGEFPLVQVCHESILIGNKPKIIKVIQDKFINVMVI